MTTKIFGALVLAAAFCGSLSAHIMVSPPDSKGGATQNYELRVHNEEKVAIKSVELAIPDGVTVTAVGKAPSGAYTTEKKGDRITSLTWTVDVEPTKYVALPFTAKNPDGPRQVSWVAKAHLTDGKTVEFSDKPGAEEKASVTKIAAAVAAMPAAGQAAMKAAPMSDADFAKGMKEINTAFMSLQRSNAAMNHEQGIKDATLLSSHFKDVQTYFEAKKMDDGVKFSKDAVDAAEATIKASTVMDMTALTSSQTKLTMSCAGCHQAHRTARQEDGSYKLK